MKKWFQPKITFLPIEQEGNIWRCLCSLQTCDFRLLPDGVCAPGDLTELGRKCGICCLSPTQGGPWTNEERLLHKSRCCKRRLRSVQCLPWFPPSNRRQGQVEWGEPDPTHTPNLFPPPPPLGCGTEGHGRRRFRLCRIRFNLNFRP